MTALEALEARFLAHLRGGERFPRAACAQGRVDSDLGLSIYANAYRARLREALENDHPVLATYLGDELWTLFCNGYIDAHPSRLRSLRGFGEHAASFLATHPSFAAVPVITELAAFERRLLDAFDAADAARVDWAVIEALDAHRWPGMRLRFHPSLHLLETRSNAVKIWQALKMAMDPPSAAVAAAPACAVWRDEERITRFRSLEATEYAALQQALLGGANFAAICTALAAIEPVDQVPVIAIGLLRQWCADGFVVALEPESEPGALA